MLCYSEPGVVNHGLLSWTSGCESIHNHWFRKTPWFTTTGSEEYIAIHNHWLNISQHDSQQQVQPNKPWFTTSWLWIMVCYSEPVGLNMVCYVETVDVNHSELYWACECESWWLMLSQWFKCAMLSQWWWRMVCYAEPCVVNHGVLFCASDCE
jgi:hypothetical protein